MTLHKLLESFKENNKTIILTFAEKLFVNCRVLEVNTDYIKINQLAFNKSEKSYSPTSNNYFVPISAILLVEEAKN